MSGLPHLVAIELEAFRGFSTVRRLDLDAGVILLRGDNGAGKTSMTDGLLWLFTGNIPRLVDRAKGRRKTEDPIVNRYRPAGPARVRLAIKLADGQTIDFERRGTANRSELSAWREGKPVSRPEEALAESFGDFTTEQFSQAVGSWGILQQHSILAALDSGATMHQRLAEVVGLERVTRFADSASDVSKRIRRECKRAEDLLSTLSHRRDESASRLDAARAAEAEPEEASLRIQAIANAVGASLPDGIDLAQSPSVLEDLPAIEREVAGLRRSAFELAEAEREVAEARFAIGEEVPELERELTSLSERLKDEVKKAPTQVQLATAALDLLGDTCPVCGQSIEVDSVRAHLQELVALAEADAATARNTERAVADTQVKLQSSRVAHERLEQAESRSQRVLERLGEQAEAGAWLSLSPAWLLVASAETLSVALDSFSGRLRTAHEEGERTTGQHVARYSAEVESSDAELVRARTEQRELDERANRAKKLDEAARLAAERVVERALAVRPEHVVQLGEPSSGRLVGEGAVRSAPVIELQPAR